MSALYLTDRALKDLLDIEGYSIETWGERVASDYLEHFQNAFDRLRAAPDLLTVREEFSSRLLFYRVEQHWLICDRFDDDMYVLAVRHGAMDLPARLAELEPEFAREAEIMHQLIERERASAREP